MQQIPPQRENPIGTFQNNLRAQNQKNAGNSISTKGKGYRPKFFPNKTLINNNKNIQGKNNEIKTINKPNIEQIDFSFQNEEPFENEISDNENSVNSNIVNLTQNK
ncbi:hypothetical protein LY90DRAFT_499788 [Neocallimastix californiae]|uniref:Uncharacterized protein n=1 Tax=Neocallimastix californiae TaxID=1754190 RepID=A0A1Y2FJ38_9FUNG|nr:hypothetical protein LY90DRAFT_499788 [Neocallimastix californiae]|eukprot:ORY82825.1 hypothetical protein LY90DRAFT_499788 [Neocallimastix californiae]